MNIHEYQAKALLKGYGAPVAEGVAILKVEEAEAAAKSLPGPLYVVKSQIHAGGRGKGKFKELGPDAKGGVRLAKSIEEVVSHAKEMLGNTLVTAQTGEAKQAGQPPLHRRRRRHRPRTLLLDPCRPLGWPRCLRRIDRRRHGHRGRRPRHAREDPDDRHRSGSPRDGCRRCCDLQGSAARRRCRRGCQVAFPGALQSLWRKGHGSPGSQSADRHEGWPPARPRCQDVFRRQRPFPSR